MRRSRELIGVLALAALAGCAPRAAGPPLAPDLPRREPLVRVGLLVDTPTVELSSSAGLELVDPATQRVLRSVPAGTPVRLSAGADSRVRAAVAGGDAAVAGGAMLLARPREGGTVTIGDRAYRGTALVRAAGPGRVTAINQVDMETYLLGVVPREIGRVGEELLEAAKAQAVAARTYAMRYLGRRESLGFDVFATVQDQVYGGVQDEHAPVSRAVRETAGEVLTYGGEPIEAFYHSTCAGQTAAIEEVWNEGPRPYLRSVVDVNPRTGESYDRASNRFSWTERWTVPQFTEILNRTLADSLPPGASTVGQLRDLEVTARTQSGRVRRLEITTSSGRFAVGGDRIRWILLTPKGVPLNSSKFDIELVRDASGAPLEVVATGGGWGHGIGMCQWGAMGRARAGQDYRTILRAYYQGAELTDLY